MRRPSQEELKNFYQICDSKAVNLMLAIIDMELMSVDLLKLGIDKTNQTYNAIKAITDAVPDNLIKEVSLCMKLLSKEKE